MWILNSGEVEVSTNAEIECAGIIANSCAAIIDTRNDFTCRRDNYFIVSTANANRGKFCDARFIIFTILLANCASNSSESSLDQFNR